MTKREKYEKAIATLEKTARGEPLDIDDWTVRDVIDFLKEEAPKPYQSKAKLRLRMFRKAH